MFQEKAFILHFGSGVSIHGGNSICGGAANPGDGGAPVAEGGGGGAPNGEGGPGEHGGGGTHPGEAGGGGGGGAPPGETGGGGGRGTHPGEESGGAGGGGGPPGARGGGGGGGGAGDRVILGAEFCKDSVAVLLPLDITLRLDIFAGAVISPSSV